MLKWVTGKIVGSQNDRELKKTSKTVEKINALEPEIQPLSDEAIRARVDGLKNQLKKRIEELGGGVDVDGKVPAERTETPDPDVIKTQRKQRLKTEQKALNEILPEVFACVREAGRRHLNMRHFDVQLIGGLVLHEGKIAEMATGEGKTLVATLAVTLNALLGRGVHLVTVNDYLARRDREWMGPLYESLGLSVGAIQHDMSPEDRKAAYACDITYGTNNEFGFDYLRNNMAISAQECAQRRLPFAIVDEVDSILIDEARTPLIISGPAEQSTDLYYKIDQIIPKLVKEIDYHIDEKAHNAFLTEEGVKKAESLLQVQNLYEESNMTLVHHINQGLRAHVLFKRDVDYMIKDDQVVIVDEFTGRLMPGRRWSDGLHQAVEAKEGVKIERENQTLATITFQNYFRMYDKLAGMTGTASTEAAEFHQIYHLEVISIPTNRKLVRENFPDVVFKTEQEKFQAVLEEIRQRHEKGQPMLVGTISIEKSEFISQLLKKEQIPHHVLNAKYHEREAQIVAQAGRLGQVTIATNMAGRGTDIVLGGSPDFLIGAELKRRQGDSEEPPSPQVEQQVREELKTQTGQEHEQVVAAGGLHVIGTERHESRRIDNQLRGRCGRQGDPGSSQFFVSLEDDLIRVFGENKLLEWTKATIPAGEAIEHPWLSRAIETAQKRVETHNFDIRKRILDYDNVMNRQREVIYRERRAVLEGDSLKGKIREMIEESIDGMVDLYAPEVLDPEEWQMKELEEAMKSRFGVQMEGIQDWGGEELVRRLREGAVKAYQAREEAMGLDQLRQMERWVMLQVIDTKWKEHLYAMDHLREGIGYRAYGQQDPLVEYQHEAYQTFTQMVASIRAEAVELLFKVQAVNPERVARIMAPTQFIHPDASSVQAVPNAPPRPATAAPPEVVGRGLPLPGSKPPPPTGAAPAPAMPGVRRSGPKVGRNDPCPCGSGKKYKKCHGS